MNEAQKLAARKACDEAHKALWSGLKFGRENFDDFMERLVALVASEFMTLTGGDGENAAKLLNEGLVPAVENNLAYLANDPLVQMLNELRKAAGG